MQRKKTVYMDDKTGGEPVQWNSLIYPARIFDLVRYTNPTHCIDKGLMKEYLNMYKKERKLSAANRLQLPPPLKSQKIRRRR